jgi:DNA-3-methyladenine glycosylase
LNDLSPSVPPERLPLPDSFFCRDTVIVARELLGRHLLRFDAAISQWLSYRIVETEAYTADDPACHAYNRKTGRAEMLYNHPGMAYVYLIYGIYNCLNVVTEPHGVAGAVLFRAVEPLFDLAGQASVLNSQYAQPERLRTNGPGRLTKALDIGRQTFNGMPLTRMESGLYLAAGEPAPDAAIHQTTRIGITKAADYPWRFYIRGNDWVSVRAADDPTPKRRRPRPKS